MKKFLLLALSFIFLTNSPALANPIISGISTNEINIDTKFQGAQILLFGAKGDAGNIVIAVRGPKKNFIVSKKQRLLGVWYNGQRVRFKDSYNFYTIFSPFYDQTNDDILAELELGRNNLKFHTKAVSGAEVSDAIKDEFQLQLIDQLEKNKLYQSASNKVDFLDETLFKVTLDFPKNISRGIYTVEIYLINEGSLVSFQSIPIHVNQVGLSAKISDFAYQESFLYGLLAVALALVIGWLANYLFARFIGK